MFELMREPNTTAGIPAHIGFFSQAGLFFWAGTASICLLASRALVHIKATRQLSQFFLVSGIFFILLTIDDAFMIHESIGGWPLARLLRLSERSLQGAYGIFFGWAMFRYRVAIANTDKRPIMLAIACYCIMEILDIGNLPLEARIFFEDGFKLLGTISLMTYFATTYLETIASISANNNSETAAPMV